MNSKAYKNELKKKTCHFSKANVSFKITGGLLQQSHPQSPKNTDMKSLPPTVAVTEDLWWTGLWSWQSLVAKADFWQYPLGHGKIGDCQTSEDGQLSWAANNSHIPFLLGMENCKRKRMDWRSYPTTHHLKLLNSIQCFLLWNGDSYF